MCSVSYALIVMHLCWLVTMYIYLFVCASVNCLCRKRGKDNLLRCTYVLPDGVTHTKGFVKDPDAAQRYLSLSDGSRSQPSETVKDMDRTEVMEEGRDRRKRVDLAKNVLIPFSFIINHLCYSS